MSRKNTSLHANDAKDAIDATVKKYTFAPFASVAPLALKKIMLTPYPAYKDSGVPWLGRIPEHWEMLPIKAISKLRNKRGRTDLPLLSVYRDYGVIRKDSRDDNHNRDGEDLSAYKVVKPGYLVANKMKAWQGSLGVSLLEGIVSPAYIVCELSEKVHPKYLHYLLRSSAYITAYNHISYGVRVDQWDMRYNDFKSLPLYLPSEQEQQHIARFLDYNTAKIARFIRSKQRMIALLREQKQAIINQAVTGQINVSVNDANATAGTPYPAYKPSGVAWLGEIPAHWEIRRLKYMAKLKSGENITSESINEKGDYPVFGGNGLRGYTKSYTHEGTYILIGRQGALCGNINYASGKFWASEHAVVVNPKCDFEVFWFGELLKAMNLNQYSMAAAQPGLSVERITNLTIPLPSLQEQKEISDFIVNNTKSFNLTISRCEREIALMQEYRARLIADVVTGQRDVRGLAVPDVAEEAVEEDLNIEEDMDNNLTQEAQEPL